MSRRIEFTLNEEQLSELEEAINYSVHPEVRQRAVALRLLHLGHHPEEVAEMVMVSANTVWTWHRRWRAGGIAGLQDQPKSGRPRKADANYQARLKEAVDSDPAAYGYSFTVWTLDRLRAHLEQLTGISLSRLRFGRLMQELGYVYRRPKRDLTLKQDAVAKQQAGELLDELKKGRNKGIASYSLWTKRP